MITIINGTPGSGKTKTGKYVFENTENSAFIDGDWLLGINPYERNDKGRLLRYKNIASLAKNYYEAGYTNILIASVYIKDDNLQEQIDLLKIIDSVKVFALVPNEETLRKRHSEDTYKREEIESSIDLSKKIEALAGVEVIDNSNISIEEVAALIKQKLGLQ